MVSARLAQSVERGTFNPKVKGSSPLSGGKKFWLTFGNSIKFENVNSCRNEEPQKRNQDVAETTISMDQRYTATQPHGSGGI